MTFFFGWSWPSIHVSVTVSVTAASNVAGSHHSVYFKRAAELKPFPSYPPSPSLNRWLCKLEIQLGFEAAGRHLCRDRTDDIHRDKHGPYGSMKRPRALRMCHHCHRQPPPPTHFEPQFAFDTCILHFLLTIGKITLRVLPITYRNRCCNRGYVNV